MSTTYQPDSDPQTSEDLLSPCSFDWADDVEDSINSSDSASETAARLGNLVDQTTRKCRFPLADLSTPDIRDYFLPLAKPSEAVWPRSHPLRGPRAPQYQPTLPTIPEEDPDNCKGNHTPRPASPTPGKKSGYPLCRHHSSTSEVNLLRRRSVTSTFTQSLSTILEEEDDSYLDFSEQTPWEDESSSDSSDDESWSDDESDDETISQGDADSESFAQQCVNGLYADRERHIARDDGTHHFSWGGYPVSHYSATRPSESLAIIQSDPKVPRGSNKFRVRAIINNAFPLVDPVIVFMNGIDDTLFQLGGSQLANASEGNVSKFYSPHGSWLDDANEISDATTYDAGSMAMYEATGAVIGNGFYGASDIRPVSNWMEKRREIFEASSKCRRRPRKSTWWPRLSPLSQCETAKADALPCNSSFQQVPSASTECELTTPKELPQNNISLTKPSIPSQFDIIQPMGVSLTQNGQRDSPALSQCETATPVEVVKRSSPKLKKNPWKPRTTIRRSQATTARSDTQHEYVSFPAPVFRRSRTKQAIKAVMGVIRRGVVFLHGLAKR